MRSNFAIKKSFFCFLGTKKIYQHKQGNDRLTIILNLLERDELTWTKRIRISNCTEKKSKDKAYSILIQKSKGYRAFDEQKVKNIAIEYRLQSVFPNPASG